MNNAFQALLSKIPQANSLAKDVQQALAELAARKDALESERTALLNLPLASDDIVAMIHAEIDAEADKFGQRVAKAIAETIVVRYKDRDAPFTVSAMHQRRLNHEPGKSSMFAGFRTPVCYGSNHLDNSKDALSLEAATFLFRREMKRTAKEAVAAAAHLVKGAKPLAEVESRIAAIDGELVEISAQDAELRATATANGISV